MAENIFNQWDQPESEDRMELVFSDRNRKYGAFKIRKDYRKNKVIATIAACVFMAFISAAPLIKDYLFNKKKGSSNTVRVEAKTIEEVEDPKEKEKEIEPPKEEKIEQVATQQYTEPKFDPNTENEADLPPVNTVNNAGEKTQTGTTDPFPTTDDGNKGPFTGNNDGINATVDIMAKFFGGDEAFIQFVKDNFNYPQRCQDEGINGNVTLRFVVDKLGKVSDITPIEVTKSCSEFTTEAIRVLKLSPRWMPGQIKGNPVKSYRVVPINLTFE